MRNRPDSESIDVVDLTIHAFGRIDEDRQHIHFERSLTRCKTRTLRVEITRALNRTCFHDLARSIGATKRQPNPAMRWAYRGSSPPQADRDDCEFSQRTTTRATDHS
jgi:hypothetical protein